MDALKTLVRKEDGGGITCSGCLELSPAGEILRDKTHSNSACLWAGAAGLFTHLRCQLLVESYVWSAVPLLSLSQEVNSDLAI